MVLLTAALDEEELVEALRLGVQGIVLKEMAPRLLMECIRSVHAGGRWMESRLSEQPAYEEAYSAWASFRVIKRT